MAATLVYVSDLHDAVIAQLRGPGGFPEADVHDGEVKKPTLIPGSVENLVQPYALVLTAPGDNPEKPLCGPDGSGEHRLYVTVAASTVGKVLDAYDRTRAVLDGAFLDVAGHQIGVLWLAGYTAPPPDRAPDAPDRWFIPLQFTALI